MWTRLWTYLSACFREGWLVLGGSTECIVKHYLFFFCWVVVSIGGGVGRFVPKFVVERGDATGALDLFEMLVCYIQFCYILL
jgi:hypothetical protein